MIKLHKHNSETYEKMKKLFLTDNRVCCVQPTGTGKSFLILKLVENNPAKKFIIFSPSAYIFDQIKTHADNNGVSIENITFITYSKLSQMLDTEISMLTAEYIVLDEFHRLGAKEWGMGAEKLLSSHPDSKILGTSATPIRYLDSMRNMADELFNNNYAVNMNLAEAIRRNILPLPVYVTSVYQFSGDIARLEQRAENTKNPRLKTVLLGKIQKAKRMISDLKCGVNDIFDRHIKNKNGKYIMFCPNVEGLEKSASECDFWFEKINKNIHKYFVHSQNSLSANEFEGFKNDSDENALKILLCVDMINEGVHVDGVDGVIMLRATQSANVFYQQLGRALSCSAKNPVIFDIVNNFETGDTANQYAKIMEIGRENGIGNEDEIEFELYDYVKDIREILNELHVSFESSWEFVYDILTEFKNKFERFPYCEETYEQIRLGVWCTNQRILNNKNMLDPKRKKMLDSIGFIWNVGTERWENNFHMIENFKRKNNRFPTTADRDTDEDTAVIYRWAVLQRQIYKKGKLSEEKVKKLSSIGFVLETEKVREWDSYYDELHSVFKQLGHIPTTSDVKEDTGLQSIYSWVNKQRKAYKDGRLTDEQIRKLNTLNIVWDRNEKIWNDSFELLKKYITENGHIPSSEVKIDGKSIGQWYNKQYNYLKSGKLSEEKIKKLESLGVELVTYTEYKLDETWNRNFDMLCEFIDKFDRFPYSGEKYKNCDLYIWIIVQKQRYSEESLDKKYIDKFKSVGIDIGEFSSRRTYPQQQWVNSYNEYKKFIETNKRKPDTRDGNLYRWALIQRSRGRHGNLSDIQSKMLKEIGINVSYF